MTTKQDLHKLIDQLPESAIPRASQLLESLREVEDPVLKVFLEAPEDDEPLTPEDIAAIEEGKAEIARGEGIPWEIVRARLLDND